jgi:hypothetical protein
MNWRAVLKPYRGDASLVRIQRRDAAQPLPKRQHLVERGTILHVGKPLDESNAIAIGNVVRTQAGEPLGCSIDLGSTSLCDGIQHGHFVRTLLISTPYVV